MITMTIHIKQTDTGISLAFDGHSNDATNLEADVVNQIMAMTQAIFQIDMAIAGEGSLEVREGDAARKAIKKRFGV